MPMIGAMRAQNYDGGNEVKTRLDYYLYPKLPTRAARAGSLSVLNKALYSIIKNMRNIKNRHWGLWH
jgi:hypothetical protein